MKYCNALSLTPAVHDWLKASQHARVLHLFDHACNLINERGEVVSIVATEIGNGPFNFVVEENICFPAHVTIRSQPSVSPTRVGIGDLVLSAADAKRWNPSPDWETLHKHRGHITNQLTTCPITNYLNPGLQSLVSCLSSSIIHSDSPSARKVSSQLAGLGAGLTPSGDDAIMGAMYAAWIVHPPAFARAFAGEIAETAAPRTTSLSAAWLRAAGRGEAGIVWHRLFDALLSGDAAAIQLRISELLSVGATSGADALAGFMTVFHSRRERAGMQDE